MTIDFIHAGDGYLYLTRTVAAGDMAWVPEQQLDTFYELTGTPPGYWLGRGAETLGVSGNVTAAQMRALFGDGLHPNADQMVTAAIDSGASPAEAANAVRLAAPYAGPDNTTTPIQQQHEQLMSEFRDRHDRGPDKNEWAAMRRDAATGHLLGQLGRPPTSTEVAKVLAGERSRLRKPVSAIEHVFTPASSIAKILFALGSEEVRELVWASQHEAVEQTLAYAESLYALGRRGRGGARRIDTGGWTAAAFTHWDNRSGDPNLHTHVAISSMVKGVDGRWSRLDARALTAATASLSCRYNAILAGKITRALGLRFEERTRGRGKAPVLELAGIPEELLALFSRRDPIEHRTEELVLDYRRRHGVSPDKATQNRLTEQATLETRAGKPVPRRLEDLLEEWDGLATQWLAERGDPRTGREFVADVLAGRPGLAAAAVSATELAVAAGVAAGSAAVHGADLSALEAAVDAQMALHMPPSPADAHRLRRQALNLLDIRRSTNVFDRVLRAESAQQRTRFDVESIAQEVVETVSARRATWHEAHIRGAVEDRVSICDFEDDAAQRNAVEQVVAAVRDRYSVLLTIDPDPVPEALQRANGESIFDGPATVTLRYTSALTLAREAALQGAAQAPTPQFLLRTEVEAAVAAVEQESGRRLTLGQQRLVEHLCVAGTRLAVAVGAAGAGKTTAMRAAVHAWHNSGRHVLALSPQKSAARVLSEEIGVPADTIASLLWAHQCGVAPPIPAGAMILIDEAGMASTADLVAVQRLADAAGAVVRWVGDPLQLSAVEAGGALRLIAADTRAPELDTVVRFADPDEAEATLHVRNGNAPEAWQFYQSHGRVASGLAVELRDQMLTAHLADLDAGTSSLMLAATLTDVQRLNGAAQEALARRGAVDTGSAGAALSDGHSGHVGDIIVTRRNSRQQRVCGGRRDGSPITNGDRWTIRTAHTDGSLTVTGLGHHGRVWLPAAYVADDVELGYACTVHRAQGVTVDRAHLLMNTTLGRSLAYVGLSRGRSNNTVYLATDTLPDEDDQQADEPFTDAEVFARVLARQDDNIAATEVLRRELARVDDPVRLREIYSHACELLGRARAVYMFDRALPVVLFRQVCRGHSFDSLAQTLDLAEQIGLDLPTLVEEIITARGADEPGHTLANAADAAAVLRARAHRIIANHRPSANGDFDGSGGGAAAAVRELMDLMAQTIGPVPARHPGVDLDLSEYALRLRARLTTDEHTTPTTPNSGTGADADTSDERDDTPPFDHTESMRADYDFYTRQLARDHAIYLLDRALPGVVMRHVRDGHSWTRLCDTVSDAAWHGFDPSALVAAITDGELLTVLNARDAAALLAARADAWITQQGPPAAALPSQSVHEHENAPNADPDAMASTHHRESGGDSPTPQTLRPIPPPHPGIDVAVADYADRLRRHLLDLDDDAPDWRARAAATADSDVELDNFGDEIVADADTIDAESAQSAGIEADTTRQPDDDRKFVAARVSEPTRQHPHDSDPDEWITVADAPTEQLYPSMGALERVIRIRADIAAAENRVADLRAAYLEGRNRHQVALAPHVERVRERVDALRPLLLAFRDARQDFNDADLAATEAEDNYHQAQLAEPEAVDEQFLQFLHDSAMASTEDHALRAKLQHELDLYRHAMADRAATVASADIASARAMAELARARADQLATATADAEAALIAAAGVEGVFDESDVHLTRLLGDELAYRDEREAQTALDSLRPYLLRARSLAADELQTVLDIDRTDAMLEVDNLTTIGTENLPDPPIEATEESATVAPDEPPTTPVTSSDADLDDAALEQRLVDLNTQMRELAAPIQVSANTVDTEILDFIADRLSKQVDAINAAQRALAAADAHPADPHLRDIAAAAVCAAAVIGAPRNRWSILLARADDQRVFANRHIEHEARAQQAHHDRIRHQQHTAAVAAELAAALQERHRRRQFAAVAAQRVPARVPTRPIPDSAPAVAPAPQDANPGSVNDDKRRASHAGL